MVLFSRPLALALLAGTVLSSPVADTEPAVADFVRSEGSTLRPLTLGKRAESGRKPRHLRPRTYGPSPDYGQVTNFGDDDPQPERGPLGASFYHGSNHAIDKQNPDNLSPPSTDAGTVPNLKWSFSLSHSRLLKGGWVREQAITDLPTCESIVVPCLCHTRSCKIDASSTRSQGFCCC